MIFRRNGNGMPTKDEEATYLAEKHYQVETGLTHVFRLTGTADVEFSPTEPIKLLEVHENTVPMGIMPIRFGPSPVAGIVLSPPGVPTDGGTPGGSVSWCPRW